jgi:glutathione S-transferase
VKLYGCPNSRSLRATWALEETGASYEYVHVDLFKGEGQTAEYLAINAAGKVPVLIDGALTLTESAAIVTYLGDRFPASGLTPVGVEARADHLRWCSFVVTELEQPLWTIAKHRFILPRERRVAPVEDTARWEFARTAALLAQHLANRDFLLGESFSGADILAGHTLAWARSAKLPLESDILERYLDRLSARPALAKARARESAGK